MNHLRIYTVKRVVYSTNNHHSSAIMSSALLPRVISQASRISSRAPSSSSTLTSYLRHPRRVTAPSQSTLSKIWRRSYVSESKRDSAQVNVDTIISADQSSFIAQTGKQPENVSVPGTGIDAGAMLSPTAGKCFTSEGISQ